MEYKTNPVKAIREKCLDCCCGSVSEIKECPAVRCPLHPFRFGENPFRQKREMSDEERKALGDRLREARMSNVDNEEDCED